MRIDAFETERLVHRPLVPEDLDGLALLYGDAETVRTLGTGQVRSRDETLQLLQWFIAQYKKHGVGLFATIEKASGRLIGRCGFSIWYDGSRRETELALLIARDSRGQGYATEAAQGFLAQAAEHLAFATPYVVTFIQPANAAGVKVARKIGMAFWQERTLSGVPMHAYRMDLLRKT
jgi:ribosomal-protein-alanine N-acetyltransferase